MTGLEITGLRAAHGRTEVLRGIDLTAEPGELLVLLGPSGAGKSTLLRVIAGLHPASVGTVRIGGRDVTALSPGQRDVAMVFQSFALFPHLSVAANIEFGLRVRKIPRADARARVAVAATTAGCAHLLDRRPDQLSGGERQRVALARALVKDPAVRLLDEPLSNVDAELRLRTRVELRSLHDRVRATTVHVTHDLTEALALADRVAVLRDGRVEQVGTPEEIWRAPATAFVASFLGSPPMTLLPADGPWPAPPGHQVGIRPESVRINAEDGVPATVAGVEVIGDDAFVRLTSGDFQFTARIPAADRPSAGQETTVSVDALHIYGPDGKRVG